MKSKRYDWLMNELETIAAKLNLFKPEVQPEVFRAIWTTLLEVPVATDVKRPESVGAGPEGADAGVVGGADRGNEERQGGWIEAEELSSLADRFGLRGLKGIEFAAVAVYFYTVLAPSHARVESVSVVKFEEACLTIGHSVGNAGAALDNAKKRNKRYLTGGKRDGYKLTGLGMNFVRNEVLKGDK